MMLYSVVFLSMQPLQNKILDVEDKVVMIFPTVSVHHLQVKLLDRGC